ncbi:thymidine phosphorylase [Erysipelotrichaceae bacterium Oil+RF-744-GAM-WT-6]|jgi:pyrimidine-nucleoside phosphorylase|uniref:Pyrimidine-nucleoside phosphorylase n=1 Tax=Stecheria intestinalis TaxID=2606630 RepID=A0A7X2TFY8_9FIRM|nr:MULTISPECIES: thymidine phosphorylase [Erysipelotrichaceae]MDD5880422.1 thymidine phosphorylase [Stecheria intestinalis]MDD6365946.1 thymidine phosphorylase [Stecheria intestinalis]MDD7679002.1 thymidine phosphorylase [Stecheria intestinalis]MSS59162.1 thymidine phosphorylase [Stecheria intestinalis]
MRFVDSIEKKEDGGKLTKEEIQSMVTGYVDGSIPDYQMSAMMMAILLKGMDAEEATELTMAMMHSGDVVDLSDLPGVKLDKHSTGGVGDTTTLVVAPLVAACGGTVAKMSGRGLGHTGGTLDKLESVPGTCIEQPMDRFKEIVRQNGVCVIGQSGNLVPADKKMYALRDVTATVRSIPLIASSIMSKKLAAGADAIVLDVKTGSGAFMRTKEEAFELAKLMTNIGKLAGREVRAVVTDMNQPLGMAVGNALEVQEAVELLSGMIPETDPLYEVCMLLGSQMLQMGKLAADDAEAKAMLKTHIEDGSGLAKLQNMFRLLGGDASYVSVEGMKKLVAVKKNIDVCADRDGYISSMAAEQIGTAAQLLGAGRAKKEDKVDPAVGLVMKVRCGRKVQKGDPLCTLYVNEEKNLDDAIALLKQAIHITPELGEVEPMVYGLVTAD